MPTYELQCTKCKHEWEDFFSIKAPVPQDCPSCKENGNVIRLISGGSGKGVVTLTGHELNDKMKSDVRQMKERMKKDTNYMANIVGERKFNDIVK